MGAVTPKDRSAVGRVEQVEVIPDVAMPPWDALFWAAGVADFPLPSILEDKSGVTEAISDHHKMTRRLYEDLYSYGRSYLPPSPPTAEQLAKLKGAASDPGATGEVA